MSKPWEDYQTASNDGPWNDYQSVPRDQTPAVIGAAGLPAALKEVLAKTDWRTRNIAGAGAAVSSAMEGIKGLFGKTNAQNVQNQKIIAQSAPVGNIAGNIAMLAPTALIPGANTLVGSALIGAGTNALITPGSVKDRTEAAVLGGAGGVAGTAIGQGATKVVEKSKGILNDLRLTNAPKDATLTAAMEAGYTIPPSMANGGLGSRLMEGLSGEAKTKQLAQIRNQTTTDSLARKAVGLADNAPLTSGVMQDLRKTAYQQGYAPVAKMGNIAADDDYTKALDTIVKKYTGASNSFGEAIPDEVGKLVNSFRVDKFDSGDAIQAIQGLRDRASTAFARGDAGAGKAAKDIASALENQVERHLQYKANAADAWDSIDSVLGKRMSGADFDQLKNARLIVGRLRDGKINQAQAIQNMQQFANSPVTSKTAQDAINQAAALVAKTNNDKSGAKDLLTKFRDARVLMAKAHTVEDAIREGGGSVNAQQLGNRLQAGKPLTGELATIGNFANNYRGIAGIPKAGDQNPLSVLDAFAAPSTGIAAGLMGAGTGGVGLAALGLPAARVGARHAVLSPAYQRALLGPQSYEPSQLLRSLSENLNTLRLGGMSLADLIRQ